MNIYIKEVIDAHVAIENWLGAGEGDLQALLARFAPTFNMITPGGSKLNFQALSHFFSSQKAGRPGLKIALDDLTLIAQWSTGAAVSYSEQQQLPGLDPTLRYSTVIFSQTEDGISWQHLHETAAA